MKLPAKPMGIFFALIMTLTSFKPSIADDKQFEELDKTTVCYIRCTIFCYKDYCQLDEATPMFEMPDTRPFCNCLDNCSDKCTGQSGQTTGLEWSGEGHPGLTEKDNFWLQECLSHCSAKQPQINNFMQNLGP
ncbi:MAG: hypothetical protein ACLFP9_04890 [Desulfonatronovibrio sp.]